LLVKLTLSKKPMGKTCEDCVSAILKEIPYEVHCLIIDKQAELKKQRIKQNPPSIERTIYTIIREWELLRKSRPAIQMTDDDDFVVVIPLDERKRMELFNAINKKFA
jgi:hypothetical protein